MSLWDLPARQILFFPLVTNYIFRKKQVLCSILIALIFLTSLVTCSTAKNLFLIMPVVYRTWCLTKSSKVGISVEKRLPTITNEN